MGLDLVFLRQGVQHGGDAGLMWSPPVGGGTPPGRQAGCRAGVFQAGLFSPVWAWTSYKLQGKQAPGHGIQGSSCFTLSGIIWFLLNPHFCTSVILSHMTTSTLFYSPGVSVRTPASVWSACLSLSSELLLICQNSSQSNVPPSLQGLL